MTANYEYLLVGLLYLVILFTILLQKSINSGQYQTFITQTLMNFWDVTCSDTSMVSHHTLTVFNKWPSRLSATTEQLCSSTSNMLNAWILEESMSHLPSNADVLGLGLPVPSDNNFQPSTSFVSLALLGNKIVVGVTLLGYGRKHMTEVQLSLSSWNRKAWSSQINK